MDFNNITYKSIILKEGIEEVPSITLTVNSPMQLGPLQNPSEDMKVEILGYKGFIDKILDKSIYVKIVNPEIFLSFDSKYLGDNLRSAIISLGIKDNIQGDFTNITNKFYMVNERPWSAFLRLSRYLPEDNYMVCTGDVIKVFSKPSEGSYITLTESMYVKSSDYSKNTKNLIGKLTSDNEDSENCKYGTLIQIPVSKYMKQDILNKGTDIINNYLGHYLNRKSFYPETLSFGSKLIYEIGQGILVNDLKYVIISRSLEMDNGGAVAMNGAYLCRKVD